MSRHSFHEHLAELKRNPKHTLPEDINKPITDWLRKIGCELGAKAVEDARANVRYETLRLVHKGDAKAEIRIQIDAGMVGERKELTVKSDEPWTSYIERCIKNPNLDKRRPRKPINEKSGA